MKSQIQSSQQRGLDNAERLQRWISATSLDDVPRNQFGTAARRKVCALLAISPSTINSNSSLKRLFSDLDCALAALKSPGREGLHVGRVSDQEVAMLAERLDQVTAENTRLQQRLAVLLYLEETGHFMGTIVRC